MSYFDYSHNPTFNSNRNDAYKAQLVLDSFYKPDAEGVKAYTKHLQNCCDNPAMGMLLTRNIMNDSGINFPRTYSRNKHLLYKNPEIKKLSEAFNNKIEKECYPQSWKAREFVIKNNRVGMEGVMPVKHNLSRELFRIYNAIYQCIRKIK